MFSHLPNIGILSQLSSLPSLPFSFPSSSSGLHACGLTISSVALDGADCPFELTPTPPPGPLPRELAEDAQQQQNLRSSNSSSGVAAAVAEAAALSYATVLDSRERPELVVQVPPEDEGARSKRLTKRRNSQMEVDGTENGNGNGTNPTSLPLRRATLRIRYAVATPDPRSGLRFWGPTGCYAHTTPEEPYGARAWLPTVDDPRASFPLDTRVTVLESQTAVAPGVLRRLRPAPARKDDRLKRKRRTFVFECSLALPAAMAAVVVGPLLQGRRRRRRRGEQFEPTQLFLLFQAPLGGFRLLLRPAPGRPSAPLRCSIPEAGARCL